MKKPLEIYASVILHQGCAIPPINETESRLHKWGECRSQRFYLGIARKTQHKLKNNHIVIGEWIREESLAAHLGHRLTVYYKHGKAILLCKDDNTEVLGSVSQSVEDTVSKAV